MFKWRKFKKMLRNEGVTGKITPNTVMMMIDAGWIANDALVEYIGGRNKAQMIVGKYVKANK